MNVNNGKKEIFTAAEVHARRFPMTKADKKNEPRIKSYLTEIGLKK